MQINPRTGLKEKLHERFRVPEVQQLGINRLRLDGQPAAVHIVPLGRKGVTLDFYSRLSKSDELFVSFHGAQRLESYRYPMFWRIASMRDKAPAFMAFADPTLTLDPTNTMLLSWYAGGPGWDPLDAIVLAIRKAQGKSGARHVCFLGGSGGGFAALRAAARFPGSMAFIQDPQTIIGNYIPRVVDKYFSTCWPGWDQQVLMDSFPERFDMARLYGSQQPENFVHYSQNDKDTPHMERHFAPFLRATGAADGPLRGRAARRHVFSYTGVNSGHGRITAPEFDRFFEEAVTEWRQYRRHYRFDR